MFALTAKFWETLQTSQLVKKTHEQGPETLQWPIKEYIQHITKGKIDWNSKIYSSP